MRRGLRECLVRQVRDPVIMLRAKAVQLRIPNLFFSFSRVFFAAYYAKEVFYMKNLLAVIGGICIVKTIYKAGKIVGEVEAIKKEVKEIRRETREECKRVWASA